MDIVSCLFIVGGGGGGERLLFPLEDIQNNSWHVVMDRSHSIWDLYSITPFTARK